MTALQHVSDILNGIPQIDQVFFIERPTTARFPCVLYNQVSVIDQELVKRPGITYAGIFQVEVHAKTLRECTNFYQIVLSAFQRSPRFLDRTFLPYDVEKLSTGNNTSQVIYKSIQRYTVRE